MPYHSHTDNLLSLLFPMDVTSLSIFHDSTFYFILSTSLIMIYSYYILSIHLRKNDNYRLYLVANFLNRFLFSISRNWLCSNWCFLILNTAKNNNPNTIAPIINVAIYITSLFNTIILSTYSSSFFITFNIPS